MNVADLVELPKKEKREVEAMSEEELGRFLKAAEGDRFYALWHLLPTTGLRPCEALGLKWDDIDLEEGKLRVQRSLSRVIVATGVRKELHRIESPGLPDRSGRTDVGVIDLRDRLTTYRVVLSAAEGAPSGPGRAALFFGSPPVGPFGEPVSGALPRDAPRSPPPRR